MNLGCENESERPREREREKTEGETLLDGINEQ
jgi:hypothetical protein